MSNSKREHKGTEGGVIVVGDNVTLEDLERWDSGCAYGRAYPDSVSNEVVSIDVQRFGASIVARTRVRYSYPDVPDSEHLLAFSGECDGRVYVTRLAITGVVDDPARFGSFSDDPVSWVHAFYA